VGSVVGDEPVTGKSGQQLGAIASRSWLAFARSPCQKGNAHSCSHGRRKRGGLKRTSYWHRSQCHRMDNVLSRRFVTESRHDHIRKQCSMWVFTKHQANVVITKD